MVVVPAGAGPNAACWRFKPTVPAACPATTGDANKPVSSWRYDNGEYPGLYYRVMHLAAVGSITTTTILIRLINVAIFTLLVLGLGLVAPPAVRKLMAVTITVTGVPLGFYFVATVSPQSWAVTGVMATWIGLHLIYITYDRKKLLIAGLLTAIGVFLAIGARADAAAYICIGAVAITLVDIRVVRRRPWLLILPVLIVGAGVYMFFGAGQSVSVTSLPNNVGTGGASVKIKPTGSNFYNIFELPSLLAGVVGAGALPGLGWLDVIPPGMTWVPMILAVGALIFIGSRQGRVTKYLALAGVGFAFCFLPYWVLFNHNTIVGDWVQPRYVLPLYPMLIGIALMGRSPFRTVKIRRSDTIFFFIAVVIANAAVLHRNIKRYVTGSGNLGFNLDANDKWWWGHGPSPMTVWIIGTLSFTAAAVVLLLAGDRNPLKTRTRATLTAAGPGHQVASNATTTLPNDFSMAVGPSAPDDPPTSVIGATTDEADRRHLQG